MPPGRKVNGLKPDGKGELGAVRCPDYYPGRLGEEG